MEMDKSNTMDMPAIEYKKPFTIEEANACKTLTECIAFFHIHYPNGGISTFLQSDPGSKFIVRTIVHPDVLNNTRGFTGHANCDDDVTVAEDIALLRTFIHMGIGTHALLNEYEAKKVIKPTTTNTVSTAVAS